MTEKTRAFAIDSPIVAEPTVNGVTLDNEESFDWNDVEEVLINNPPHEAAFDTDRFYKIDLVAARPIEQDYGSQQAERLEKEEEDRVTLKKPADELREAAWSLDNAPLTLGHPLKRIVTRIDQVHGFIREPSWDSDERKLRASAYIPTTDGEALNWIDDNDGVSIGFFYEVDDTVDDDSVDAYQRDLFIDHLAVVDSGRCSREDGCGLAADSFSLDDSDTAVGDIIRGFKAISGGPCSDGPCSCGKHVGDGENNCTCGEESSYDSDSAHGSTPDGIYEAEDQWFAVAPDEHSDDSTDHPDNAKYEVGTCADVDDAWGLRTHGDYDIEQSTLEARIKRAAEALDCGGGPWDAEGDAAHRTVISTNVPSVDGSVKEGGDRPRLSDFTDDDWSDLTVGQREQIANHALVSTDTFPPEKFNDLKGFVVTPDGDLALDWAESVYRNISQVAGVDDSKATRVRRTVENLVSSNFDADEASITAVTQSDSQHMTDGADDNGGIDVSDLELDAIADRNDEVDELIEERDEYEAQVDAAREQIEDLEETVEALDTGEAEPKVAIADDILDTTDKWERETLLEMDREELDDKRDLVEEFATGVDTVDAEGDSEVANDGDGETTESGDDEYVTGQVYDLSDTA